MHDGFVTITEVRPDHVVVEWTFPNGWKDAMVCANEHEARVFADGLKRGVASVRNLIGLGLHVHAELRKPEPPRADVKVTLPGGTSISYSEPNPVNGHVKVKVDGSYTGSIVRNGPGWHYQPKGRGNRPGETFDTVGQVKYSLEN